MILGYILEYILDPFWEEKDRDFSQLCMICMPEKKNPIDLKTLSIVCLKCVQCSIFEEKDYSSFELKPAAGMLQKN